MEKRFDFVVVRPGYRPAETLLEADWFLPDLSVRTSTGADLFRPCRPTRGLERTAEERGRSAAGR